MNTIAFPTPEFTRIPHHDRLVWVRFSLAGQHREHCLCYSCKLFKPDTPDNCKIAAGLLAFDIRNHVTTPVWECETMEPGTKSE